MTTLHIEHAITDFDTWSGKHSGAWAWRCGG